jgi:AcrR family transcriptional regulator
VPLPNPPKGHVLELVRDWLATRATFPKLHAALQGGPGGDAAEELAGVIDELYDFVEQNRLLLLLMESLADDYPGLTDASVNDRKRSFKGLVAAFLAGRAEAGVLRPLADPEIAAHFLVESVAWFAQHRKRDAAAAMIDDQEARSSLRTLLLAAFLPATTVGGGHQ